MEGYRRRRLVDQLMTGLTFLATALAVLFLVSILGYVVVQGLPGLNLDLFTSTPRPVGEPGGGMANAMVGSLYLVFLACLFGLPLGILTGVFLSEYGGRWLAPLARFVIDVLTGLPSIIVGLFVYAVVVRPLETFSALAGGLALGILMIPTVARTTEEMLRLVPLDLREAALALGIRQWRTIVSVVIPTALSGIVTGSILAIARVGGETAPLLFTAFGNRDWNFDPLQPTAALTLQIFTYAISPYEEWHRQAWAGALVLVVAILGLNIATRLAARGHWRPW